jgi:hypothetical protein
MMTISAPGKCSGNASQDAENNITAVVLDIRFSHIFHEIEGVYEKKDEQSGCGVNDDLYGILRMKNSATMMSSPATMSATSMVILQPR